MAQFVKATKEQAKLRMALIGSSGSGKTYTSLLLATILGKRIALVDTEHGSASKYADEFNFDTLQLSHFSPEEYIDAIQSAARAGYDVLVIDSLSHAWAGVGGILEFVDNETARSRAGNSFASWRKATPVHNRLVDTILQSDLHILATMRAKTEYVMEKDEKGKTVPRKVGLAPVQRDGLEYEFDIVGDMDADNTLIISKTRCRALAGQVIHKPDAALGKTILDWLTSGVTPEPRKVETPRKVDDPFVDDPVMNEPPWENLSSDPPIVAQRKEEIKAAVAEFENKDEPTVRRTAPMSTNQRNKLIELYGERFGGTSEEAVQGLDAVFEAAFHHGGFSEATLAEAAKIISQMIAQKATVKQVDTSTGQVLSAHEYGNYVIAMPKAKTITGKPNPTIDDLLDCGPEGRSYLDWIASDRYVPKPQYPDSVEMKQAVVACLASLQEVSASNNVQELLEKAEKLKTQRPYAPNVVREKILAMYERMKSEPIKPGANVDKMRGAIKGTLSQWGNDGKQHQVLDYLFGLTSTTELTYPHLRALQWWIARKPNDEGVWQDTSDTMCAQEEFNLISDQYEIEHGQMTMEGTK